MHRWQISRRAVCLQEARPPDVARTWLASRAYAQCSGRSTGPSPPESAEACATLDVAAAVAVGHVQWELVLAPVVKGESIGPRQSAPGASGWYSERYGWARRIPLLARSKDGSAGLNNQTFSRRRYAYIRVIKAGHQADVNRRDPERLSKASRKAAANCSPSMSPCMSPRAQEPKGGGPRSGPHGC